MTFACNGATGTVVQISSAQGFGVLSIRCIGNAGSDVQRAADHLDRLLQLHDQRGWRDRLVAAGGAPRIVITSASLPTPGHPFAETLEVLMA